MSNNNQSNTNQSNKNEQLPLSNPVPLLMPGDPMAADPVSHYDANTSEVTRLTTGDLNNDGYPDIAAAHGLRTAGIYLNQGDQSFAAEHVLKETWWDAAENTGATSIALGDLDRDGNLDLVIPIYGDHYQEHMVQLYRGLGDGTFELWPVDGYNANQDFEGVNQDGVDDGIIVAGGAANPMFPLIADFNGDGLPDVAVSANNGNHSVDVLLQSADRQFSVADSDPAGQNPQFMAQSDFNEDGSPDVVAGALYDGVLVFLNDADGKGTLRQEGGTYLSDHHHYVITADFNGDGHEDIAARGNVDNKVFILYGDGGGLFPSTANFTVSGQNGYLAAADIDKDGDSDLVVASTSTKSVDLLLNDGSGGFDAPVSTILDAAPWGIAAADFDQDGWVDVAVARADDTVQVLWNRSNTPRVSNAAFQIAENSPDGSAVGTVLATPGTPGETLAYAITAGNADPDGNNQPAFAIDAKTGAITVNDPGDLDFETSPQFSLTVTATDTKGISGSGAITVNLANVDEPGNEAPIVQDATFTLPENSANGTEVGAVVATDIDAGDMLAYAITNSDPNGNGKAAFAIDPATGQITVNDSGDLDFETTPTFNLTVKATDAGGLSDTATITINLTDVFELNGTPGNDKLKGTDGNDVINGLAGDDTLSGGGGDDELIGGEGIDRVSEQGNVDFTLTDGRLTGLGSDRLAGIERVKLAGGDGANVLDASGFNNGPVVLNGGAGDDTLIGPSTAGSFFLYNVFIGGAGNDTLTGGTGMDHIKETGDVDFTLTENRLTGLGTDRFSSMEQAYLIGGLSDNRLDASGFTGRKTILEGNQGNDTLLGGLADDWVKARGNADLTLSDSRLTGLGTDTLVKMDNALLIGGAGDNRIDAADFTGRQVILAGGAGDDTLIGRSEGIDWVRARANGDLTLTDTQLSGLGVDTLEKIDNALLAGGDGDNRLDASGFTGKRVVLSGGAGNDTFIGRAGGIDWVLAHSDQDFTLTDTQLIGLGTDTLIDIDQAKLIGDGGNNTLDASAFTKGRVFLDGENGNDTLKGGKGDDILVGGLGDDRHIGGAGTDRVAAEGDLDFTLTDTQLTGLGTDSLNSIEEAYLAGGMGNNILDASAFTGVRVILEGEAGDDRLIGRSTGIDRVRAQGDVDFTLTDTQLTGLGTDALVDIDQAQLLGNSGDNLFDASLFTRGPVSLSGGGGMDTLLGGSADDTLAGGYGDDIINGGLGRDILIGGAGADSFRFTSTSEIGVSLGRRDVIKDFDLKQNDKIDLSAIDANLTLEGLQAFAPLTEGKHFSGLFSNPAELYFDQTAHILYGNNDADNKADFALKLVGVDSLLDAIA